MWAILRSAMFRRREVTPKADDKEEEDVMLSLSWLPLH